MSPVVFVAMLIGAALGSCCSGATAAAPDARLDAAAAASGTARIPAIVIDAAPSSAWRVTWEMPTDVRELVFPRSTDDSRVRTWRAPEAFELAFVDAAVRLRRRDGGLFRTVTVEVPPTYRSLPEDYAPFAPFGDGGLAFHTGRLFACGTKCPPDARWNLTLRFEGWRSALVGGHAHASPVAWADGEDGSYVYVGDTPPLVTPQLAAVLDRSLPDAIRAQLLRQLPAFMTLFAERLGPVRDSLAVFVSYDTSQQKGWGRQGGVLPGQLVVHFYGAAWPDQMSKPVFADDLAWHLAHEAAHVYQRQLYVATEGGAWIHEGGAEAFAALAMRASAPASRAYVEARVEKAAAECHRTIGERSVRAAIQAGDFEASYACGLAIALVIDREVRRMRPDADGLYAVWRDYIERAPQVAPGRDRVDAFIECVSRAGGAELARWVRHASHDERPTLEFVPDRIGADRDPPAGGAAPAVQSRSGAPGGNSGR